MSRGIPRAALAAGLLAAARVAVTAPGEITDSDLRKIRLPAGF